MISHHRARWLTAGFWLLPAAVATLGLQLVPSRLNPDLSTSAIIASQLLIWMPWGMWTLLLQWVTDRVPFERGRIARALLVHVPLSAIVVIAQIAIISRVTLAFGMSEPRGVESIIVIGIRQYGDLLMVVYWAVVGTLTGLRWHARWQEERLRTARLGEDLANANLQALRAQLNPHFLFNALNAVVTLIPRDPELARTTVVRLSEMLRATLTAGDAQETTLAQELALTARYLEIESVRFADRLQVTWTLDDTLSHALVPAFTLQPLVENALRHGLGRRSGAGTVEIISRQTTDDALELIVRDGGPGPVSDQPIAGGAGIALQNLRARLLRLYGPTATIELLARDEGGTDAVVRIHGANRSSRTTTDGSEPAPARRSPVSV